MSRRALKRFSIAAVVVGVVVFVDGLVLLFTNGLKTTATPILPELGGSFSKTRSSGASLVVLGVAIVALALVGWWWLSRRMKNAAESADADGSGAATVDADASPGSVATTPSRVRAPSPTVEAETHEPASSA